MSSDLYGGANCVAAVYGPSGLGKCLAGTCEVLLTDGRVVTVKQMVESGVAEEVVSIGEDYKIKPARVSAYYRNGMKQVVRVKTRSGRQIDVTGNHPLLGGLGWQEAKKFKVDELIAVPRSLPFFGNIEQPAHHVDFLALFLADGGFRTSSITYTNSYPEKLAAMQAAVDAFGDVVMVNATLHGESTLTYRIRNKDESRRTHSVHTFLRSCGLEECKSATKALPDWVMQLPRHQVARFLSLYLGSDGAYEQRHAFSFSSASEKMLRQVSHLLLRFGVRGRIRVKYVKGVPYWEWGARTAACIEIIRTEIAPISKVIPEKISTRADTLDVLPITNRNVDSRRCWPDSPITRYSAQRLESPAPHVAALANSDVYWDRVLSIEPLGEMETFDLTVPGTHNFVSNDIFAHNTVDMLYSFPRGLFIAPPGALKPAYSVVGFVPASTEVNTIMEATELLKKHAKSGEYDAIIADDFSLLAEQTVAVLEKKNSGFTLWGKVRDAVLEFRDVARKVGLHVVLTAHEAAPKTSNGAFIRGGPKLPGKLPEEFPGVCDIVLRAAADPTRRGWHACYRCTVDDASWVTKDRHGVTPDRAPMNLGEILRLAGYRLRRAPGLEWQDDAVAGLTEALMSATAPGQDKAVLTAASAELQAAGHHDLHIRWALRDALDRVALTRAKANVLGMYL